MPSNAPRRGPGVGRRDVLRALAATVALPALAGSTPRRRVAVIGGGMAGVALAWLLDGSREVVLYEARDAIGGNVQSLALDLPGGPVLDVGAQYFHPGPYPLYAALLRWLGLFPPDGTAAGAHEFIASITVSAAGEPLPRFVSPVLPGRAWPLLAAWNRAGIQAFATAFRAAADREAAGGDWDVTLDEWLPTLGLARDQWEGMLLPWAASLFSGRVDEARGLSARAAFVFAATALPAGPLSPVVYYTLRQGLIEVQRRLLAASPGVEVRTGARVRHLSRRPQGGFRIRCEDGRDDSVDDLVLATSGPDTVRLLRGLPGTAGLRAAVGDIAFTPATIAIHREPTYAPALPAWRSFLNCRVDGDTCEASMWMADLLPDAPAAEAARFWKSWVTLRSRPPEGVVHERSFLHLVPSVASLRAQRRVADRQGEGGVRLAGGYLWPYDSQESALRSALQAALGLGALTPRVQALAAVPPG